MPAATLVHDVLGLDAGGGSLTGLSKFELGPGAPVEPAAATGAGVSLYTLDDTLRAFVFVEVAAELDLRTAPFLYVAQREHARRVIIVPYAVALDLAAQLPVGGRPALLYSVGRCGSTLLCQALGELAEDRAVTLSEPDVYTHVVGLRLPDGSRDAELVALVAAATRFLTHAFAPDGTRPVIKFRGWCTVIADLIGTALPTADAVFLTRDLNGWLQSMNRLLDIEGPVRAERFGQQWGVGRQPTLDAYPWDRFNTPLRESAPASFLDTIAMTWTGLVRHYVRAYDKDVVRHSLSYDGLCAAPGQAVRAVADAYGLTYDRSVDPSHAPAAFARDSQAGSRLSGRDARAKGIPDLGPAPLARAAEVARRHGVDPAASHQLPGDLLG